MTNFRLIGNRGSGCDVEKDPKWAEGFQKVVGLSFQASQDGNTPVGDGLDSKTLLGAEAAISAIANADKFTRNTSQLHITRIS